MYNSYKMTLILDQVLNRRGLNASELERLMNAKGFQLSRISIGNILSGKSSPKVSTLQDIADTLDVDISEFFDSFVPDEMKALYEKKEDGTYQQIGYIKK